MSGAPQSCLCPNNIHKPEICHQLELVIARVSHYSIIVKIFVKWYQDGRKIDSEVISVSRPSAAQSISVQEPGVRGALQG